jgi:hypothetical protein
MSVTAAIAVASKASREGTIIPDRASAVLEAAGFDINQFYN